ncbi:hypothetical protein D3C81_1782660 [compost metagenome]
MKIETLSDVRKIIQEAGFFEAVISSVSDWDEALDERGNEKFDKAWVDCFNELNALTCGDMADEKIVKDLREFSFKKVFPLVRNSEIASYISDDIGLVADAVSKANLNGWAAELFETYLSGEFPR